MWQTQWPDWVYKQFDVDRLASQVAKKVKMLCKAELRVYLLLHIYPLMGSCVKTIFMHKITNKL